MRHNHLRGPGGRRAVLGGAIAAAVLLLGTACGSGASPTASGNSSSSGGAKVDQTARNQLPASIKKSGVVRVATTFGYPPQEFYEADGKTPTGFSVDLANALGEALGVRFDFTNATFDSVIPGLLSDRFDVAIDSMSATSERGKQLSFVLYENPGAQILVGGGNPKHINGLADLCGLTVAGVKGVRAGDVIDQVSQACQQHGKPAITQTTFDTSDGPNQAVASGRADASFRDSDSLSYTAGQSDGKLAVAGPIYPDIPYGVAVPPNKEALAKAIQSALSVIIQNGTYGQIIDKWKMKGKDVTEAKLIPAGSPESDYPTVSSPVDQAF